MWRGDEPSLCLRRPIVGKQMCSVAKIVLEVSSMVKSARACVPLVGMDFENESPPCPSEVPGVEFGELSWNGSNDGILG